MSNAGDWFSQLSDRVLAALARDDWAEAAEGLREMEQDPALADSVATARGVYVRQLAPHRR